MFDYVKRSELDAERELRVRAETQRDEARSANVRLLAMLEEARQAHSELLAVHAQSAQGYREDVKSILDRFAPVIKEPSAEAPETPKAPMTLEEALMMPAVGVNQIVAKRNLITELRRAGREIPPTRATTSPDMDELSEAEAERVRNAV